MSKKLIFSSVVLIVVISIIFSFSIFSTADELEYNLSKDELWEYAIVDDLLIIQNSNESAYFGDDADLVIPDTIDGITVAGIGENAFLGNTTLNSVTIPKSVSYISDTAFSNCDLDTIYGYCESYARSFANDNGYKFSSLGHCFDKTGTCVGSDSTLPELVTLKAGNVNGGIKLTLNTSPNANTYELYRADESKNYELVTEITGSTLTYQDLGLESGKTYTYSILVKNSNGEYIGKANLLTYTYLGKTFVTVSNVSKGVKVSWDKVPGADHYDVYRKVSGDSSYKQIGTTTSLSYTDTTMSSGTTYVYMARAVKNEYKGTYSGVTVLCLKAPTVKVAYHSTGIKISWTSVSEAEGYKIYRKVGDGSYSLYKTTTDTSFIDTAVTDEITYSYYVRSYKSQSNSTTLSGYYSAKSITAPCKGIDVSRYNGDVDFTKVKSAGYKFVAIRCGTSYHQEYNKDIKFEENYKNARAAGLKVGVYFYTYATTVSAAKRDAEWCLEMIKDKSFEYPIALDIEDPTQKNLSKEQLSAIVKTFCDTVKKAGYYVCVYSYLDMINNQMDDDIKNNYEIWVAQWNSTCTYKGQYGLWQNSDKGKIPGINATFDTDYSYKDFETIISSGGYNKYAKDASNPKTTVTNMSDGIKITFEAVKGATSYSIFRQTKSGLYMEIAKDVTDLIYFDKDVESGANYSYKILPNVKGVSYAPVSITRLDTPNVSLSNVNAGVKVSWNSIPGATSYTVYRKTGSGSYTAIGVATSTSFTDKTAKSNTTYYYTVKAINGTNKSNYKGVSILFLSSPTTKAGNSYKGVKVSWTPVDGAQGYYIYRKTGSESYSKIATVKDNSTLYYYDATAVSGKTYDYMVKPYNGSFKGSYIHANVIFIAAPKVTVANNKNGMKVSWTKVDGAESYCVYRKIVGGSYSKIATINSSDTLSFIDKTAVSGTKYTYTVRACKDSTFSGYTGVTILRLSAPVVKVANNHSSVKITWTKSEGAEGYCVYRKVSGGSYSKIATIKGNETLSYYDKSAVNGTTYTYMVRSFNGSTKSGYAGVNLLRLSAPSYTLANTKSGVKITVANKINGAQGYIIYRKDGDGKLQKIGTTTSLTYTDKTAKSGTTYTYAVRAYNGDYLGGYKSTSIKCKK